jgi:hypothetical protein
VSAIQGSGPFDFGFWILDFGFKTQNTNQDQGLSISDFGFRIEYINELDSYFIIKILDRIYRIFLFPNFPERKLGNSIRLRRKLISY